jgi:hypothetical protein
MQSGVADLTFLAWTLSIRDIHATPRIFVEMRALRST